MTAPEVGPLGGRGVDLWSGSDGVVEPPTKTGGGGAVEGGQCFAQAAIANISITPERDVLKDQIGRLCRDPPAKRSRGADGFTFYDLIKTRGLSSKHRQGFRLIGFDKVTPVALLQHH